MELILDRHDRQKCRIEPIKLFIVMTALESHDLEI